MNGPGQFRRLVMQALEGRPARSYGAAHGGLAGVEDALQRAASANPQTVRGVAYRRVGSTPKSARRGPYRPLGFASSWPSDVSRYPCWVQEPLEQRVRRLERSNRRLKIAGGLLALLAVACGSGVTSTFTLVRTERLQIIDKTEAPLISLTSDGGGQIVLHDGKGNISIGAAEFRRLLEAAPAPKAD